LNGKLYAALTENVVKTLECMHKVEETGTFYYSVLLSHFKN